MNNYTVSDILKKKPSKDFILSHLETGQFDFSQKKLTKSDKSNSIRGLVIEQYLLTSSYKKSSRKIEYAILEYTEIIERCITNVFISLFLLFLVIISDNIYGKRLQLNLFASSHLTNFLN
jgi:hypothetical protein